MSSWWGTEDDWCGLRFGMDDMEIIGDSQFSIGVPDDFDERFKKMVFAAAKAYTMGYASIDYFLKQYGENWTFDNSRDESYSLITEIVREIKHNITDFYYYFASIENKPDKPNLFACSAAIVRLQNTFRAAIITIKSGLRFESAVLERMIIEQLAWIYVIHNIDIDKTDHFDIKPSECIGKLKTLFPFAGRLYGLLSKMSHIEPKETLKYISMEDVGLVMHLTSLKHSRVDVYHLLLLADMLLILGEYIYADLVDNYRYLTKSVDGNLIPNKNRKMIDIIENYKKRLFNKKV